MSSAIKKLSSRGYKITPQRRSILEVINKSDRHLTAEEITEQVKNLHPSISAGTIYRNLNMMVQNRILSKLDIHDGAARFEIYHGHNHHLFCLQCGSTVKLDICPMQDEVKRIVEEQGFMVDNHHFEITGYCRDCQLRKSHRKQELFEKGNNE